MTSHEKQAETEEQNNLSSVVRIDDRVVAKQRVAVLVVGMHRSGTSALTKMLNLLGCDLPKDMVPASKNDNELGFWESKPVTDLNEEILASAGSFWNDWLPFSANWYRSPVTEAFRERAQEVLQDQFGDSRLLALKDPRICRLLPLWTRAVEDFGAHPFVVIPIRNPFEVAASLNKRNEMEVADAQLFWLRHVLDAEVSSRDLPRVFVRYDDLLSSWRGVARRVEDAFGFSWSRRSATLDAEIDGFLSSAHRHNFSEDTQIFEDERLSPWIRKAFEILRRWSSGGVQSEADRAALDKIREALNEASPAFEKIVLAQRSATKQNRQDQKKLAAYDTEVREVRAKLEVSQAEIKTVHEAAAKQRDELQSLRAATSSQETIQKELTAERSNSERAESEAAELRNHLATTKSALAQRQAEADETSQRLATVQAQLEGMQAGADSNLSDLLDAMKEAHDKRVEAEVRSAQLQERLSAREQEVQRLRVVEEEIAALRTEKARGDQVTLGLKDHVSFLMSEVNAHREAREKDGKEISALHAAEQKAQAALSSHAEELAKLQKKSDRANMDLKEARSELRALQFLVAERDESDRVDSSSATVWSFLPLRIRRELRIASLRRSGRFDAEWYLNNNSDVAAAKMDPVRHFVLYGEGEGRAPNGLQPDVKKDPSDIG